MMGNTWLTADLLSATSATSSVSSTAKTRSGSAQETSQAVDTAAYWSISTTVSAGNLSLTSTEDSKASSAAVADLALLGMTAATDIVSQIKSTLTDAKAAGADKDALGTRINDLKDQLKSVVDSSSFDGQNWLKTDAQEFPTIRSVVGSVETGSDGSVAIGVTDFDQGSSNLIAEGDAEDGILTRAYSGATSSVNPYSYYMLDASSAIPAIGQSREISLDSQTTGDQLDGMISAVNGMMTDMISASADIRGAGNSISSSADFVISLHRDVTQVASPLQVNTDLGATSVNELAQTVQAGLKESGLNIANSSMAQNFDIFA